MKNTTNVIIIISDRNKFDENGKSLDAFNSTEVEVFENDVKLATQRIGGTNYRKPEYVGKKFIGYIDSLGFERIVKEA